MIGEFKKIKGLSDVKVGDNIILYSHSSPTAKTVKKLFYHVTHVDYGQITCTRLKKDGTTFRDRWYDTETAVFAKANGRNDVFMNRYGSYYNELFYVEPDIPCGLCINKLMKEKCKLNKGIMDLQKLMYSVE